MGDRRMSGVHHLTAVSLEVSSGRERLERGLRLLLEDVPALDCPRAKRRKPRPSDGLWTAAEAAARLRCSIKTLKGHVAAGRLKYVLVGHGTKRQRRMFSDADLILEDVPALDCPRAKRRKPRPSDGLWTAAEAAARLRCSIKTLKGHVAAGRLKYVLVGHGTKRQRRMFSDADLNEFIANQTRKDVACPSIEPRARLTGTSIFNGEVIGFTARRSARLAAKRKR
jgi:hypothetical protein